MTILKKNKKELEAIIEKINKNENDGSMSYATPIEQHSSINFHPSLYCSTTLASSSPWSRHYLLQTPIKQATLSQKRKKGNQTVAWDQWYSWKGSETHRKRREKDDSSTRPYALRNLNGTLSLFPSCVGCTLFLFLPTCYGHTQIK